ncbi:hypothetical protein WG616_02920 [[Mycoplasma] gypis]|uniref:Beta-carotene 15,15'-monooxygenase n=1 Tax=[Mycoplasma] gypis TaxID=92404 RepID=A0ABZ2RVG4_9BACT
MASRLINVDNYFSTKDLFLNNSFDASAKNFNILYNIALFFSLIVLTGFYNYRNIHKNLAPTLKYIPWFVVYVLFSIISLVIPFVWNDLKLITLFYKSFLFIILFLINFAYDFYTKIIQRKTSPISKRIILSLIISQLFKLINILILLMCLYVFVNNRTDGVENNLFVSNPLIDGFENTFFQKGGLGYVLLFLLIIAIILMIAMSQFSFIYEYNKKQYIISLLKNTNTYSISVLFSIMAWYFVKMFSNVYTEGIIIFQKPNYWLWIIFTMFSVLVIGFLIFVKIKIKNKQLLNNYFSSIGFSSFLIVLIFSLILRIFVNDKLTNTVILLMVVITALSIYQIARTIYTVPNIIRISIYILTWIMLQFVLITQQLNIELSHLDNTSMSVTSTAFNLPDIGIIIILCLSVLYLIIKSSTWIYASVFIYKRNKKGVKTYEI